MFPPPMLTAVLEIARHELAVAVRTRRALVAVALYLCMAALGGLVYVMAVRAIEQQAMAAVIKQGVEPARAANAVSLIGNETYEQLLSAFVGAPIADIAPALTASAVPVFMWGTLAFLPFLILLSSFDHVVTDLRSRAICYTLLRAPRGAVLMGKTLAQAALFIGVMSVSMVVLGVVAAALLSSATAGGVALGMLRAWVVLIPFGLCYLGIVTFASTVARQPFGALLIAFFILIGLRAAGWFGYLPLEHWSSVLRPVRWLSPGSYETGLWLRGFGEPLLSSACYLAFGALFVFVANVRLRRRDL